jgi:hypothetical protein
VQIVGRSFLKTTDRALHRGARGGYVMQPDLKLCERVIANKQVKGPRGAARFQCGGKGV